MSSIRFHTQDGLLGVVGGPERFHACLTSIRTSLDVLGVHTNLDVLNLVDAGVLPRTATAFSRFGEPLADVVRGWLLDPFGRHTISIAGDEGPVMHAALNTAAVAGPDTAAFLARLHGSVEDCIWVDAHDVPWFTEVLTIGRQAEILRPGEGWEEVIDRLSDTNVPVVISSSQGRPFPDVLYDEETGRELPVADEARRWQDSMERLRASGWWLQLTPENLREPAYTPCRTFQELPTVRR